MIWLHHTFLHDLLDLPTRIFLLCLISDQKWAADHYPLLHLPFGILSLTYPLFRFITGLPWSTQDLLISKVSSTIDINSLHNVSSDFDLRAYNGHFSLPCTSHIASFRQNNMIAWKGRPRCLQIKTKRVLNSLLLLLLLHVTGHANWLMVAAKSCVRPHLQWHHLVYITQKLSQLKIAWLYCDGIAMR